MGSGEAVVKMVDKASSDPGPLEAGCRRKRKCKPIGALNRNSSQVHPIEEMRATLLRFLGGLFLITFSGCSANVQPIATVSITASPSAIAQGNSSTLSVVVANATEVTLTGSDGSSYSLGAQGGTKDVRPATTTTYTVMASGPGGSGSSKTTVKVYPLPTVGIIANPTSVFAGSSSILTVTAANASQVTIAGSDGSKYSLPGTGGTQAVTPNSTTVYTATASGAGGSVSSKATLTVSPDPVPTVTITANPKSINFGSSSSLTVTATFANQVTVAGSDGSSYTLTPSGGLQAITPNATTTFVATATGLGGTTTATTTVTVTPNPPPSITIVANPRTIVTGHSATLTVTASNATQVTIAGTDGSSYSLSQTTGGTQSVTPTATTTYTVTATGEPGTEPVTAASTVTLGQTGTLQEIDHAIFMLQENHSFDNYFGMLNPYRKANGWSVGDDGNTYTVDGIDDKLTTISNQDIEGTSLPPFKLQSTCVDEMSSFWDPSLGDVNHSDFSPTRPILMDGFVFYTEAFTQGCLADLAKCSGSFTDLTGQRAMGYYDQGYLNYYYFMASQFAVSDRWFSPVATYSVGNRIATFSGGTTQGLVKAPSTDLLPQLAMPNIFEELDQANVSWKIYYTVTNGLCLEADDCPGGGNSRYPATTFSDFTYSYRYMYENPSQAACTPPTRPSNVVGDSTNSFCIDPTHIAPLSAYFSDLSNGTLPSFVFIEAGYGNNDEHPGSGQSVLLGQAQVASVVNALMASSLWNDSVFFFSYDEGGGPYDHVPPVPGYSNQNTDSSLGTIPDISTITVNPDSYLPCLAPGETPTAHCDLLPGEPGSTSGDVVSTQGFAAQLGFRLPNIIISPFTRRHYVSHTPMDHTAVVKFVENRFIGNSAHLTARDAVQPDLLEFFDFTNIPWASPPVPPAPVSNGTLGYNSCTPSSM